MADKHPYVSAPGNLVQVVTHFRKSFPATVTAQTLKKLGYAPKNESYVLNVLRYLGLIDQEGKRTAAAAKAFNLHDDAAFSEAFAALVKTAYANLFELHGDTAWQLDSHSLITFFRSTDDTTELVGKRQAATFQLLAAFSGYGEVPTPKATGTKATKPAAKPTPKKGAVPQKPAVPLAETTPGVAKTEPRTMGLTVRIEVNLPADGDQETYDRIFKSIRENLLYE